jgi:hypothetical protein
MPRISIVAAALFFLASPHGAIAQAGGSDPSYDAPSRIERNRIDQAAANYRALRSGAKQVGQLTPQELADVDALDRRLRGQKPDTRSPSQRCVDDELRRAGGSVSALTRRVIDAKCREAGD